jgi:hypothetical protein
MIDDKNCIKFSVSEFANALIANINSYNIRRIPYINVRIYKKISFIAFIFNAG